MIRLAVLRVVEYTQLLESFTDRREGGQVVWQWRGDEGIVRRESGWMGLQPPLGQLRPSVCWDLLDVLELWEALQMWDCTCTGLLEDVGFFGWGDEVGDVVEGGWEVGDAVGR